MSLKAIDGEKIYNQKENQLFVNDFNKARDFLLNIGCQKKAYQENTRELWQIDDVEITIDHWSFLKPFVEIESQSEIKVKEVVNILEFDYNKARFCFINKFYAEKYKISQDLVNNYTSKITFNIDNPFK
jgi:adenylate cyclase class IV